MVRAGGLTSTVGYLAIPVLAVLRGQPAPYVVAAVTINALIFVRRLEGVGEDVELGASFGRAMFRRALFDASGAR